MPDVPIFRFAITCKKSETRCDSGAWVLMPRQWASSQPSTLRRSQTGPYTPVASLATSLVDPRNRPSLSRIRARSPEQQYTCPDRPSCSVVHVTVSRSQPAVVHVLPYGLGVWLLQPRIAPSVSSTFQLGRRPLSSILCTSG